MIYLMKFLRREDGVLQSPNLFVVHGPVQIFQNLFCRSNQRSVQLDRSSSTVLTKDSEHGSHVVVVCEFHPAEVKRTGWVGQWTSVFNTNHPPRVSLVELMVDLIQLILQPGECDIVANPKQMGWCSAVVVDCS